jgi:hypothetical protein
MVRALKNINAGNIIYRGVPWDHRPDSIAELSYPPVDKVTQLGRLNRPGQPVFYASCAGPGVFYELKAREGSRIAFSEWEVMKPLWMHNLGYHSKEGVVDSKLASAFGDYADAAVRAGDFANALIAADRGIKFDPALLFVKLNRAHALMFLDRTDEARREYLAHRGKAMELLGIGNWEDAVKSDFSAYRAVGLERPLMTEIERLFESASPPSR